MLTDMVMPTEAARIYEGTNQINRMVIARQILK